MLLHIPCRIWDNFSKEYGFSLTRRKFVMTEQTASQTKNLRKKLQKQEQRIFARLKAAQKAQAKALERYHRAEERLQKRMARVQVIEGRLTLIRQQIDDLNEHPAIPSAETGIPTWAQFIHPHPIMKKNLRASSNQLPLLVKRVPPPK